MRSASGDACNCMSPTAHCSGHFRHEIGHYYWDRLVADSDRLEGFRRLFGDERADYSQALERHYQAGPTGRIGNNASSANTPARIRGKTGLKRGRTTSTSPTRWRQPRASGLSLRPQRSDEPSLDANAVRTSSGSFDQMIDAWFPLTYLLNNLNRGMGLPDGYPFVLSTLVIDKLRFVHTMVEEHRRSRSSCVGIEHS